MVARCIGVATVLILAGLRALMPHGLLAGLSERLRGWVSNGRVPHSVVFLHGRKRPPKLPILEHIQKGLKIGGGIDSNGNGTTHRFRRKLNTAQVPCHVAHPCRCATWHSCRYTFCTGATCQTQGAQNCLIWSTSKRAIKLVVRLAVTETARHTGFAAN